MPFSSLRKMIHIGPEPLYGTPPVFDATLMSLVEDFKISPMEGDTVERRVHSSALGGQRRKIAPRYCKVEFKIAMTRWANSAADTPPPYAAILGAAGFAQTVVVGVSSTFSPVSTGFASISLLYNQGGEARTVSGIRGGAGFEFKAGGIPYIKFSGMGFYGPRASAGFLGGDYTGWMEPLLLTQETTQFTFGGGALGLESLDIPIMNVFGYRNRPNQQTFVPEKPRDFTASLQVLDEPRASFDPEAMMRGEFLQSLDLRHGTAVGQRFRLLAGATQVLGVEEADLDGEAGLDLNLAITASRGGNDDLLLILS